MQKANKNQPTPATADEATTTTTTTTKTTNDEVIDYSLMDFSEIIKHLLGLFVGLFTSIFTNANKRLDLNTKSVTVLHEVELKTDILKELNKQARLSDKLDQKILDKADKLLKDL